MATHALTHRSPWTQQGVIRINGQIVGIKDGRLDTVFDTKGKVGVKMLSTNYSLDPIMIPDVAGKDIDEGNYAIDAIPYACGSRSTLRWKGAVEVDYSEVHGNMFISGEVDGELLPLRQIHDEWIPVGQIREEEIFSPFVDQEWAFCENYDPNENMAKLKNIHRRKIPVVPTVKKNVQISRINCQWFQTQHKSEDEVISRPSDGEYIPLGRMDGNWVPVLKMDGEWVPVGCLDGNWVPVTYMNQYAVPITKIDGKWLPVGSMEYEEQVEPDTYPHLNTLKRLEEKDFLRVGDHIAIPHYADGRLMYWQHAIVTGFKWSTNQMTHVGQEANFEISVIGYARDKADSSQESKHAVREECISSKNIYRAEYKEGIDHQNVKLVLGRAREHLQEERYSILTNNSEHFAVYCKTGKWFSAQYFRALLYIVLILPSAFIWWCQYVFTDQLEYFRCTVVDYDIYGFAQQFTSSLSILVLMFISEAMKAHIQNYALKKLPIQNQGLHAWHMTNNVLLAIVLSFVSGMMLENFHQVNLASVTGVVIIWEVLSPWLKIAIEWLSQNITMVVGLVFVFILLFCQFHPDIYYTHSAPSKPLSEFKHSRRSK